MAKKKIAALLIAAAIAAGGWALPARVSAAENDGTAVTWQQDVDSEKTLEYRNICRSGICAHCI